MKQISPMELSIVIPCYNSEKSLYELNSHP